MFSAMPQNVNPLRLSKMSGFEWSIAPEDTMTPGNSEGFRSESPYDYLYQSGRAIADRPDYEDYKRSKKVFEYRRGADGKLYKRLARQEDIDTDNDRMVMVLSGAK